MQLKKIYINSKPTYKFILWVCIVLTIYILYGLYYPKTYYFSCEGTQNLHVSQIIKDPLDPKEVVKNKWLTKEDIFVNKYFFGLFYTINDFPITKCMQASDSEIFCFENKGSISFNPQKNTFSENFTTEYIEKNEKNYYFAFGLSCTKDNNSLN